MAKTYWVNNNPNGEAEWLEMNGQQFYDFITSPAGKGRYFMDFDTYKIEVTKKQYQQWKAEMNRSEYLQRLEDEVSIISLESLIEKEDDLMNEELMIDDSINIENEVIANIDMQLLSEAINSLPNDERILIEELFLCENPKTEQEIAAAMNVSQQAINKKKKKILKKLKILVVKS